MTAVFDYLPDFFAGKPEGGFCPIFRMPAKYGRNMGQFVRFDVFSALFVNKTLKFISCRRLFYTVYDEAE